MKVDGGCHCGYITFEAEADPDATRICHCTDCQRLTGSAFRVVVPVPDHAFKMLSGEPTIYIKIAESGTKRMHAFCPRCGSPIYATAPGDGPKSYGVRVGSLTQRNAFVPKRQYWCRSAQPWAASLAGTQRFEKQ
jgi:hypothetical protein